MIQIISNNKLGGGFKYFLFSPLFGEGLQFDQYFSNGLKPPTSKGLNIVFLEIMLNLRFDCIFD